MARPLGPVRLRRTNYFTLALGACLCLFIIYFLAGGAPQATNSPPVRTTKPPIRKPTKASLISDRPPVVRYDLNNVTITPDPIGNQEGILILTPMSRFYQGYWDNLLKLNYPHNLVSLGFILPKTKEGNAATTALQHAVAKTQKGPHNDRFRSIVILRQDFDTPLSSQDESERHKLQNQKPRREAMSKARNSLLFTTLGIDTSWVLWLDADIVETPATLIQDLAGHDKPIIVPNCFQRFTDDKGEPAERPYDFNSWQDSSVAQELGAKMGKDEIIVEGYQEMATYRTLMAYVGGASGGNSDPKFEMPLDGVGGTALLVRADVHRDGAMFPPFPFYHLIETEGFAKMAKRLGWHATGLPNYKASKFCKTLVTPLLTFTTRCIITTSKL